MDAGQFSYRNGGNGLPGAELFDTNGSGASYAAKFQVGLTSGAFGGSNYQGGWIYQMVALENGPVTLSADIAAYSINGNGSAGLFNLLLDGVQVASQNLGWITPEQAL